MAKPAITDPRALAVLVEGLGGTPLVGQTFRFDMPLEKTREIVPRLNELHLGVRKVSERIEQHETRLGDAQTIVTCEIFRPQEPDR